MKRVTFFFILFLGFSKLTFSSGWHRLGSGTNRDVQSLFIDTTDGKLYAGGEFYEADGKKALNIAVWNGNDWDSMGGGNTFGQYVLAITKYQNQIYADGRYTQHNPYNSGGRFNGTSWDSIGFGVDGFISQFKERNNLLWVSGLFDMAGNDSCNMLATWDGTSWNCEHVPYNNSIEDFEFLGDTLIIGGHFFDSLGHVNIAWRLNNQFYIMGHRLYGAYSVIHSIAIFNGEIYIAGYITTADGNEGNNIMKWNGAQWEDVGGGTDNEIFCLKVYENQLYASGAFTSAGGIIASKLARWDGFNWHAVTNSTINNYVRDFTFYQGSLFIGGDFYLIDADTMWNVAQFSGLNDIANVSNINDVNVYPNPVKNEIRINDSKIKIEKITIYDFLGKVLFTVINNIQDPVFDISFLASGIYFITLESKEGRVVKKFVKE